MTAGRWTRERVEQLIEDLGRKYPPRCLHCDVILPEPPPGRQPWPVCADHAECHCRRCQGLA
jgi:hypothetical protein